MRSAGSRPPGIATGRYATGTLVTFLSAAVIASYEGGNGTRPVHLRGGATRHTAAASVPALGLTMGIHRVAMPHPSLTPVAGSPRDRLTPRGERGAREATCRAHGAGRTLRLGEDPAMANPARSPSSPIRGSHSSAEAGGPDSWGLAAPVQCVGIESRPVRVSSLENRPSGEARCARTRRGDRRNILFSQYLTNAARIKVRARADQKRRKVDFGPASASGSVMMPPYRRAPTPLGRQLRQGESRCHGKR